MAEIKAKKATIIKADQKPLFEKDNYRLMLIGLIAIGLGLFLMAGGKSKDPNVFNADEVYSKTRITLAPLLILAGFVTEIFAIFKKPKSSDQ